MEDGKHITFRMKAHEKAAFMKRFEESGLRYRSDFVRQAVLTAQVKPPLTKELQALLREIRAQGNNINQIAKVANASRSILLEVLHEVQKQHKIVITLLKDLSSPFPPMIKTAMPTTADNNADTSMHISLRVKADENRTFLKRFKESGLRYISDFARQAVLTVQVIPPLTQELQALFHELHAQGNNLNQIAKVANASGFILPDALREVQKQQRAIIELLRDL